MIHAGTDLKFKVSVNLDGFDINEDNMTLAIKNRWGQTKYSYIAEDFFDNGNGEWFFTMPNVQKGRYYACLTCHRIDEDFEGNEQKVVDVQPLVNVDICDCYDSICNCHATDGMQVIYERVWTVNLVDGVYLADVNGQPIMTSDGQLIRFSDIIPQKKDVRINMTADEFKHYWDDRDDNGVIDTRKEIHDALGGINDDTELSIMTNEDTDNMMNRILNRR